MTSEVRLDVVALGKDELSAVVNQTNAKIDELSKKLAAYEKGARATTDASKGATSAVGAMGDKMAALAKAGDSVIGPFNKVKELVGKVSSNWLFLKDVASGVIDVLASFNELKFGGVMAQLRELDTIVDRLAGTFAEAAKAASDMRTKAQGAAMAGLQAQLREAQLKGDYARAGEIAGAIAMTTGGQAAGKYREDAAKTLSDAGRLEAQRTAAAIQFAKVDARITDIQGKLGTSYGQGKALGGPGGGETQEELRRLLSGTSETPGLLAERERLRIESTQTSVMTDAAKASSALLGAADAMERTAKLEESQARYDASSAETRDALAQLNRSRNQLRDTDGGGGGGGSGGGRRVEREQSRPVAGDVDPELEATLQRAAAQREADAEHLSAVELLHKYGRDAWEDAKKRDAQAHEEERKRVDERLNWIRQEREAEEEAKARAQKEKTEAEEEQDRKEREALAKRQKALDEATTAAGAFVEALGRGVPEAIGLFGGVVDVLGKTKATSEGMSTAVIGSIDSILNYSARWFKDQKDQARFLGIKELLLAIPLFFENPPLAVAKTAAGLGLLALSGGGGGAPGGGGRGGGASAPRATSGSGGGRGDGGTTIINLSTLVTDRQSVDQGVRDANRYSRGNGYERRRGT